MANTKSAQKAVRKIARRTAVNKSRRSQMRTYVRKVEEAIAAKDAGRRRRALRDAEPLRRPRRAEGHRAQERRLAENFAPGQARQSARRLTRLTASRAADARPAADGIARHDRPAARPSLRRPHEPVITTRRR